MYKIVAKQVLNPTVVRMEIQAPYVAKKAQAGWTTGASGSP
mgnify:CR=1 FL=1